MNVKTTIITNNDCYQAGRTITPKGIMVHSTATPGIMAEAWYNRWNKPNIEKAVHAFVDDTIVCQHLPWNHRAWHAGASANNTHISFEMCEPSDWKTNKAYFEECYKNAVELTAYLCKKYSLKATDVISHKEGHQKGTASNHGDPDHWWRHFGYTMDMFRADVAKMLNGGTIEVNAILQKSTIAKGDEGTDVLYAQKCLNRAREAFKLPFNRLEEDGAFGGLTEEAVKMFQRYCHLDDDGIVGSQTWNKLDIDFGDLNADGKINSADAQIVLKAVVGKSGLSQKQKAAADMNQDGRIGADDAQEILKRTVGK